MSESEALAGGGIDDFLRALAFSGGTTSAIVSASAALLGATAGLVGAFAVLRGRSLVTDAIGHATLPGVVGVFAVASWLGLDGRHPAATMLGAALSATAALFVLARLRDRDGIPVDAATSTALSGAFGLGIVLLSLVQGLHVPNSGGLDHLLFGQVATARASDLLWLAAVAVACLLVVLVTRHDLTTIAFDEVHARVTGVRVALLDRVLLALVFAVTVSALPVVGAVLVVALVVLPVSAARFWSDRFGTVLLVSALLGGASAHVGSAVSFAVADAPAGAVIILTTGGAFLLSAVGAPRRGLVVRSFHEARSRRARRARGLASELARRADGVGEAAFVGSELAALRDLEREGRAVRREGRWYLATGAGGAA